MKNRSAAIYSTSLVITLLAAPVYADGAYIGASAGQAWIDVSNDEIEDAFTRDDGFVASGTTIDDTDSAWKAFAGYRFNSFLALEAAYVDLGKASFLTTIVSAPPPAEALTPFQIRGSAEATGYSVAAMIGVPLGASVLLFAKGGAFHWNADFSETIPGVAGTRVERSESDTKPAYGAGLELRLSSWARVRAEWERFEEVGSGIGGREGRDVDLATAGLVIGF